MYSRGDASGRGGVMQAVNEKEAARSNQRLRISLLRVWLLIRNGIRPDGRRMGSIIGPGLEELL
jgi:hypothetical protein